MKQTINKASIFSNGQADILCKITAELVLKAVKDADLIY